MCPEPHDCCVKLIPNSNNKNNNKNLIFFHRMKENKIKGSSYERLYNVENF